MKKYIIEKVIDKLNDLKEQDVQVYGCDLSYQLWECENIDGTMTYNSYDAKEFIKKYYDDIGEVVEEINFQYGENFLQNYNPFENPERFMCLIVLESSNYLVGKCDTIQKNWNNQFTLTKYYINKIIKELKGLDNNGLIYE